MLLPPARRNWVRLPLTECHVQNFCQERHCLIDDAFHLLRCRVRVSTPPQEFSVEISGVPASGQHQATEGPPVLSFPDKLFFELMFHRNLPRCSLIVKVRTAKHRSAPAEYLVNVDQ